MTDVDYQLTNSWSTGFQGLIRVTNDGTEAITGWQVTFTSTARISDIWGATILSHSGDTYVVQSMPWNATINPGGTVDIGFIVRHGGVGGTIGDIEFVTEGDDPPAPVVPDVSIGDVVVDEDSGTATLHVTLSEATTEATSVAFATAAGTADASDFLPASGTLTFAAGETEATVTVQIVDDAVEEGDESFSVVLSDADGLTIADGTGTVTIRANDAPPTLPEIAIETAISVDEGNPSSGPAADGWFSTSGSDIIDSDGNVVRITGVNWFGGETTRKAPDGLHVRSYQDMMDQMKEVGFNAIRLPFSNDMLRDGATPTNINYSVNPDLAGLSSIEVFDKIIDYAGEIGIRIILDNHRNAAGDGPSSNGLWYGEGYTHEEWVADWETLTARYQDNPTVVGFDLSGEPFAATWGSGDPATDWRLGAEDAIDAIHEINPEVLVLVEGIAEGFWWGGDLRGVESAPIRLDETDKLVYSPHVYPNSIYAQPWFNDPNYPENLTDVWDYYFGYIAQDDTAPILVGEFGSRFEDPKDLLWMEKFIPYLTENGLSYTYWSWNPNSGDTGGILENDWTTVIDEKVTALEPSLGDELSGGDGTVSTTTEVTVSVSLSEPSSGTVLVDWMTADGTAIAGEDYVAANGTLVFAPGETSASLTVEVVADTVAEDDETFSILLANADGGILTNGEAIITIRDNDATGGGGGGNPVEENPDTNGDGIFADIGVRETWAGGFIADGHVNNDSNGQIDGWTVEVNTSATITDIWNSKILSHTGDTYVIGNISTSGTVNPGADMGWGFVADGIAAGLDVSDVTVITDPDEGNDNPADTNGDGVYSDLVVRQTWTGGFVADGEVINDSSQRVDGWSVEVTTLATIRDIWNAEIASHEGDTYVITNNSSTSQVDPDTVRTWGFVADGLIDNLAVSDVILA
ncbi:cellulase family glycosylhydrolase [Acuticoccus sediminis]|uniref:cellulase family glycosylhydrolase n=1 Tax=Acuticoccus sediminis TaxID=2184697 RepID=UPI001391439D|nr:cellulase family glycosylhydrolase [Acuticoccus sediminis]